MRRRAAPFAFIVALSLVPFVLPLVRGEVFTFRDHLDYFQPLRWFTATELRYHRIPFWNPYNASGEPWLANPQTCVFYPPAWIFLALPFPTAYMLFLWFHLALLGCGAFVLFEQIGSRGAAILGAVALMLCGPTLSLLDINNNLASFAWIAWVIAAANAGRALSPPGRAESPSCVGSFFIALSFLAGEPLLASVGAVIYAIVLTAQRRFRELAITGIAAFGLSAIELLPFLEIIRGSDRTHGIPRAQMFRDSMPLRDWLRVAVPPSLSANGFDPALVQHFIPSVYLGVLIVLLAIAGVVLAFRRAVPWLILLAFTIITAAGTYIRASAWTFEHLPLILFRYPARVVPLGAFAIIALAVLGWSRVRVRRWIEIVVALALFIDLAARALPMLQTDTFRTEVVPFGRVVGRAEKFARLPNEATSGKPVISSQKYDRLTWISGYLNLYDRRFDVWTAAPLANARYTSLYEHAVYDARIDLLDRMSVGFLLSPRPLPLSHYDPVAHAGSVFVGRSRGAYPLAWLRTADGHVLAVALFSVSTRDAHVIVDAPEDGIVVITQQDAPGWDVTVDGRPAAKLRDLDLFRAVAVKHGHHEIFWRYRPRTFVFGFAITLLALLSSGIAWGKFFSRHSKRGGDSNLSEV
jgi:hypothetical protein